MGVDDDIRDHARCGRRHVLRVENHSASSLLAVARRELVANLWNPVLAHTDLGEAVALAVPVLEDAIHPTSLIVAHGPGHIAEPLCSCRNHHACRDTQRHILADKNVISIDIGILWHEAGLVQLGIVRILHLLRHGRVRTHEALLLAAALVLALLVLVGAVEDGAEQATVQRPAINHDRILLIISSVGQDCDDNVLAGGHRLCSIEAAHERRDERDLGIAQQMRQGVKAVPEVECIHSHCLLTHSRLVGVSGRLIVIREGDVTRQSSKSSAGMDLGMCVGLGLLQNILWKHCDVGGLRLAGVNILHQVVPAGSLPNEKTLPVLNGIHLRQKFARSVRRDFAKSIRVEERAEHSAGLGCDPDLSEGGAPDDSGLNMNPATPLGLAKSLQGRQSIRRVQSANPGAIQKEASGGMLLRSGCVLQTAECL